LYKLYKFVQKKTLKIANDSTFSLKKNTKLRFEIWEGRFKMMFDFKWTTSYTLDEMTFCNKNQFPTGHIISFSYIFTIFKDFKSWHPRRVTSYHPIQWTKFSSPSSPQKCVSTSFTFCVFSMLSLSWYAKKEFSFGWF
jgi:hypothetical protein